MNLGVVSISAPRLQSLHISCLDTDDWDNLTSCQVMIFGPSIKYFSYNGQLVDEYCLCSCSILVEASVICIDLIHREREVVYRINKLLREFSNIKCLSLTGQAIEVLKWAEELFVHLPVFHNLTKLEVVPGSLELNCRGLHHILRNCPSLESAIFDSITCAAHPENDDQILNSLPSCFLSRLKSITIVMFEGIDEELSVLRILLKNTPVLERMAINCLVDFEGGSDEKKEVHYQLVALFRRFTSSITYTAWFRTYDL
ncbi:unnamed protein product [Ilex paraguariensis]|uniref:FBD domain-containing protein n=1 Tax=Ilex paraguariensis TaxID=185542 RepID=A0ABC8RPB5_9AQUA